MSGRADREIKMSLNKNLKKIILQLSNFCIYYLQLLLNLFRKILFDVI